MEGKVKRKYFKTQINVKLSSWSDGDQCWDQVSGDTKREMGLHYLHDGEFWIEFFDDFCKEFEVIIISLNKIKSSIDAIEDVLDVSKSIPD